MYGMHVADAVEWTWDNTEGKGSNVGTAPAADEGRRRAAPWGRGQDSNGSGASGTMRRPGELGEDLLPALSQCLVRKLTAVE